MTKQDYLKYFYTYDVKRNLIGEMYYRNTITSDDVNNYIGSAVLDLISLTAPYFSEENEYREPLTDAEQRWLDSVIERSGNWYREVMDK